MEQEAVETSHIGVALAFLGVVIFFVLFSLRFGQKLLNHTIDKTAEQNRSGMHKVFDRFLSDDADGGHTIPASAVYSFIGYNGSHIGRVVCFDPVHNSADITAHHYGMERDSAGRIGAVSYPDTYNDIGALDEVPDVCIKRHLTGYVRVRAVFDRENGLYILYVYPAAAP